MKKRGQWDPALHIGIGLIDNQHKIIFDLINDLGTASAAMADRKVIDTLLDVIENYVFRHFEAEEELFRNQRGAAEHCLEHYDLIKDFHKFRLSSRNRNSAESSTADFLAQWFVGHIKEYDVPFFTSIGMGGEKRLPPEKVDDYPVERSERRRHKRIEKKKITDDDILAYCYNTSSLKNSHAAVIDISLGGVRITSHENYAPGDLLIISCTIGKNFKMKEKIRIVNVDEDIYGAEFVNLSPATEKFLIELYGAVTISNR